MHKEQEKAAIIPYMCEIYVYHVDKKQLEVHNYNWYK